MVLDAGGQEKRLRTTILPRERFDFAGHKRRDFLWAQTGIVRHRIILPVTELYGSFANFTARSAWSAGLSAISGARGCAHAGSPCFKPTIALIVGI